jgi:hypothetical protein
VTPDTDVLGVLCKMQHIFTNAEYADTYMLYVSSFCDGSAAATVVFSQMYCIILYKLYQLWHMNNTIKYRY